LLSDVGEQIGKRGSFGCSVDESEVSWFLSEGISYLLLGGVGGEYILGIEYLWVYVFKMFSFYINRLRISV
jgi:hypothetical protein